ncbi:hypothetical protein DFJ73DRAFT_826850 [Zopfochytrium polystomum]|nr:hypothetical protein DFJ73DRAFT_826850 [Zopfochytrium polystomum]
MGHGALLCHTCSWHKHDFPPPVLAIALAWYSDLPNAILSADAVWLSLFIPGVSGFMGTYAYILMNGRKVRYQSNRTIQFATVSGLLTIVALSGILWKAFGPLSPVAVVFLLAGVTQTAALF